MSVRIGEVLHSSDHEPPSLRGQVYARVAASTVGVELTSNHGTTLDPIQARNYAALLVRGANEVERMRRNEEREQRKRERRNRRD